MKEAANLRAGETYLDHLRIRNGRARNGSLRWLPVFSPHSPPEVNTPCASLYWGRFLIPGFGKMGSNVTALSWPYPPGSRQVERQRAAPIAVVRNAAPMRSLSNENGEWA